MDTCIRPTLKFIKLGYAAAAACTAAAAAAWLIWLPEFPWLPVAAAFLLLWPAQRHARRLFTRMTITGDKPGKGNVA